MTRLYSFLIFLIPSISMLSGLFVAPVVGILFAIIALIHFKSMDLSKLGGYKIELMFLGWLLLSCIWSIAGLGGFSKFLIFCSIFIATILISDLSKNIELDYYKKFAIPLVVGCFCGIILFFVEYMTEGFFTKLFRSLFQPSDRQYFALHFLDRGCSVLAIVAWPAIYALLSKRKWLIALILTIIVAYVLRISDSLASWLGFMLGIFGMLFIFITRMYGAYLLMLFVVCMAIFMPTFSYKQNPRYLSDTYSSAPDSGKHRLFIWKYTANKAMEKPFFGWGYDSSSYIPIDEDNDIVYYNQYRWYPLPLHPHNCFMQIWLEGGIVGLALYVLVILKLIRTIIKTSRNTKKFLWGSFAAGCFINYLFIAMISFGMWQVWWMSVFAISVIFFVIFKDINKPNSESLEKI